MKSEFFCETDQRGFSVSIRDTKFWASLKDDPSFKNYRGMIKKQFPDHPHEYFIYDLAHLQPEPFDEESLSSAGGAKSHFKRAIEETHDDRNRHSFKRQRHAREVSPHLTSIPRSSGEQDVTDTLFRTLNGQVSHGHSHESEERSSGPHNSTLRHDSGYQSAQSGERRQEAWSGRLSNQTSPAQRGGR